MARPDIVIVGGGMVGLAAGVALAREGVAVQMLESASHPPRFDPNQPYDLRVSAIAPATTRLLSALGVWDQIAAVRAEPYVNMTVWDASAPGEMRFTATDIALPYLGHIVENALIADALRDAFIRHGGELTFGTTVSEVVERDRNVSLTLADGEKLRASLLIAADGARSSIRDSLGIDVQRRDYQQKAVVATVELEHGHERTAWQRFLPGGPVAFLPLADHRCSIVWSLPVAQAETALQWTDADFSAALERAAEHRFGEIKPLSERRAFPLQMQIARRYVSARTVLLGDAAHVVHPLAGLGANLGFADAALLRDLMVRARTDNRDVADPQLLRRYERARRSDVEITAQFIDKIDRMFRAEHPLLRRLRGIGLTVTGNLSPLRQLFTTIASGTYAGQPELMR